MTTLSEQLRASWENQQSIHAPDRELRFQLMLDNVEVLSGRPARVLDLACGPGSITRRVLQRFPFAQVVALDIDPLLLDLARSAFADDDRVDVVEGQLASSDWDSRLAPGFDAILTSTAMHWLPPDALVGVYAGAARLLRPGGVFANADHVPLADPVLRQAADELHAQRLRDTFSAGAESCDEWYQRAYAEPVYAGLWEERQRRLSHWVGDLLEPSDWHLTHLHRAGFAHAEVIWRRGNDAVVLALKPT